MTARSCRCEELEAVVGKMAEALRLIAVGKRRDRPRALLIGTLGAGRTDDDRVGAAAGLPVIVVVVIRPEVRRP